MKKISYNIIVVILFSLSSLLSQCAIENQTEENITTLSADKFVMVMDSLSEEKKKNNKISKVQLLDVRTPEEWENGSLKEAYRINYLDESFTSEIEKLDKSQAVMVFCASGNRSAKAAKVLSEKGFMNIYNLNGGYQDIINKRQK